MPKPKWDAPPSPLSVAGDPLFPIRDVAARLEPIIGRRINRATSERWGREGVAGVRLDVVFVGRRAFTSMRRLEDFLAQVTSVRRGRPDEKSGAEVGSRGADIDTDAELDSELG